MGDYAMGFAGIAIYLVVVIGLFLVLRNVVLWYYKINIGLDEMKKQTTVLEEISRKLDEQKGSSIR